MSVRNVSFFPRSQYIQWHRHSSHHYTTKKKNEDDIPLDFPNEIGSCRLWENHNGACQVERLWYQCRHFNINIMPCYFNRSPHVINSKVTHTHTRTHTLIVVKWCAWVLGIEIIEIFYGSSFTVCINMRHYIPTSYNLYDKYIPMYDKILENDYNIPTP